MTVHVEDEDGNHVQDVHRHNQNNATTTLQQQNGRVEDVDGCVQFTSIVSASFMLVHCPNWMSCDLISLVDQMHKVCILSFHVTVCVASHLGLLLSFF